MAKSKSQQATNLAKQYTADQLAAAMIYGETRAGVDAKGRMADQLAGVRELRTAENRAKATGKDINSVLTQPKQYQGLNQKSLNAISNPDSLKNPAERAAANAALAKAKDYFAGKYEGQVGKGTPYENITSFNKATEQYNLRNSGAVPGSHVEGGQHSYFSEKNMADKLAKARGAEAQAAAKQTPPIETLDVGSPTALTTPQGTAVAPPKGEISAGQQIQGSNVVERGLGPIGQKEEGSPEYAQGPAFFGTGTASPLYQVPRLDPYSGTTLGAGNVAGIQQYAYASPNKSIGQGQGQGQGQGAGAGAGPGTGMGTGAGAGAGAGVGAGTGFGAGVGTTIGTGAGAGQGQGAGASQGQGYGTGIGLGDGAIGGGGYGSADDLPTGYGDGTIGGGGYGDMGGAGQLPSDQQPQQGPAETSQQQAETPSSSGKAGGAGGFSMGDVPSDYGSQYGPLPGSGGENMGQSGAPADNQQAGIGMEPGAGDTGSTQMWGNQELGPSGEEQTLPPPGAGISPEATNPTAPEQTPTPSVPENYTVDTQPTNELPPIWLTPDTDAVAQNDDAGIQYASLNTGTINDGVTYTIDPSSYLNTGSSFDSGASSGNFDSGGGGSSYDSGGYDSGGGGGTYDSGGGGFDMMTFDAGFASGGSVKPHIKEALKRTRKFAANGPVTNAARMILSRKASSRRGRPE